MHILLGIGGSTDAMVALQETLARTATTGDSLTIAILENPATDRTPAEIERAVEEAIGNQDVDPADIVRLDGDPGPAIVEFAESGGYDRIVLGGGKRSPMGKIALGQVAEFVLLNADTSVTLIR